MNITEFPVYIIIILTQVSNHVSYISNHVSYISNHVSYIILYKILYRKHQWMWCKHTIVSYEKSWLNLLIIQCGITLTAKLFFPISI